MLGLTKTLIVEFDISSEDGVCLQISSWENSRLKMVNKFTGKEAEELFLKLIKLKGETL